MAQAKTLNDKEMKRVLATITNERHSVRNRTMLYLTHLAGLRVGEVASLMVKDVLSDDGHIKNEIVLKPEQTKGSQSRVVVLSDRMRKYMEDYLTYTYKTNSLVAIAYGVTNNKPLFFTQKSIRFSAASLTQYFFHMYRAAGINGSSHSGRRTFITKLASKGVGVRVLMALAGHKNISTTQHYIDYNPQQMHKAVELLV